MGIRNLIACLGILCCAGCSTLVNVRADSHEKQKEVILEEIARVNEEITYDRTDYTNNSDYSFYYRPPQVSEELGKGDCKDLAIVSANRLQKAGLEVYNICGKVDNEPHIWLEWYSNGIEYVILPQEKKVIRKDEVDEVVGKKFSPYINFSEERRARIEKLRSYPGCENLKFNEDVPYRLREFGKRD